MKRHSKLLMVLLHLLCLQQISVAQVDRPGFQRKEVMIAMRDGVKLFTVIHQPEAEAPLPLILLRSPYGVSSQNPNSSYLRDLAADGYIFVFQDIRGRHKSEGDFAMIRSPRDQSDPRAVDESSDAYDTIEWLVKNVPNNSGKVGMLGISYDGWLTSMALIDPHPALRAASPQSPPADMFLGDDFHHNGAFRLSYGFEYVAMMEAGKANSSFRFDKADTYEWYLKLGPLRNANDKYLKGKMPTWNDFVSHPNYDQFWQKQAATRYMTQVKVPTLNVTGWWDQEDFYGPLKTYAAFEKHDKENQNFLVVGPWNHGGWAGGDGESLGGINFGSKTGKYYREQVQAPFFARFLKQKKSFDIQEALTFQTGKNEWVKTDRWPPREVQSRKLYFHPGGKLSLSPPQDSGSDEFDTYVSDPNKPIPYRPRPIQPTYGPGSQWRHWLVMDQRFAHNRPDVASWETEPLQEDLVVAGGAIARLFASTSGSDSDWIVKLIDVFPDDGPQGGYQLMVANEVFRARFRKSFEHPEALEPGRVYDYAIDMHWLHHCFKKGHKIMVQVQSTWFPLIDRNPQTFVANIFEAKASDYRPAEQRIYRTTARPSCVEIQVRP